VKTALKKEIEQRKLKKKNLKKTMKNTIKGK